MYDSDKDEEIRKTFKFRFIAIICSYLSIAVLMMGAAHIIFLILGIALLISFFVINWVYWKCPFCRRNFNMRQGSMDNINHCPYCGQKLRNPPRRFDIR